MSPDTAEGGRGSQFLLQVWAEAGMTGTGLPPRPPPAGDSDTEAPVGWQDPSEAHRPRAERARAGPPEAAVAGRTHGRSFRGAAGAAGTSTHVPRGHRGQSGPRPRGTNAPAPGRENPSVLPAHRTLPGRGPSGALGAWQCPVSRRLPPTFPQDGHNIFPMEREGGLCAGGMAGPGYSKD